MQSLCGSGLLIRTRLTVFANESHHRCLGRVNVHKIRAILITFLTTFGAGMGQTTSYRLVQQPTARRRRDPVVEGITTILRDPNQVWRPELDDFRSWLQDLGAELPPHTGSPRLLTNLPSAGNELLTDMLCYPRTNHE